MILVIDNKIDPPHGSADLIRYLSGEPVLVKRGPDGEVTPKLLSSADRIVISGSKTSCMASDSWIESLLELIRQAAAKGIPIFGICFGHQMIARAFGGFNFVRKSATPEFGWIPIQNEKSGKQNGGITSLFSQLPRNFMTFASHFEEVATLPDGFECAALNDRCGIQGFQMVGKPLFGVQFHPERNAEEGQKSIDEHRNRVPVDAIFNDGKSQECFNKSIAETMFREFLKLHR